MKDLSLKNFKKLKKEIKKQIRKSIGKEKGDEIRTIKLINDNCIIISKSGEVINLTEVTPDIFEDLSNFKYIDDLKNSFRKSSDDKHSKYLNESFDTLSKIKDFIIENDSVYFKGIERSIPKLLVNEFTKIILEELENSPKDINKSLLENVEYQSLKRFFMWCCLNPRAEVANDLYQFLMNNSFRITKQGFFVALRNVVSLQSEEDNKLVSFISNAYNKIKAVWKKNPKLYKVVTVPGSNEYELKQSMFNVEGTKYVCLGDLEYLYLNLPNMKENRFTDAHTRTFDIRVGKIVSMPPEECNWSRADCAHAGLHFTSDEIHYVGCGDTSVLILINPMKVVGIGSAKGRCYEYFPIMTVPREEATSILHDLDFDTIDLDELYLEKQLENLEETVKTNFSKEVRKHNFNISNLSNKGLKNIMKELNYMKSKIDERILKV